MNTDIGKFNWIGGEFFIGVSTSSKIPDYWVEDVQGYFLSTSNDLRGGIYREAGSESIIYCSAAKFMFNKDFKHDVSKQMFARWQAHSAPFNFTIEHIKGKTNSLPDFLSREYLNEHRHW